MSQRPVEFTVRGVLFDMDGVLMSSLGSVERSWRIYARSRGVEPKLAVSMAHGRRAFDTVQALRPDLDPVTELRAIEDLEVADKSGIVVLPGVRELIASLPDGSWGIVTSATKRLAVSRLEYAGFAIPENMVTAEMVTHGKPDPEPYRMGATLLDISPADCLVIEDAPAGVASGKAAGCRVLAVLTTHPADSLTAADERVETLASVKITQTQGKRLIVRLEPA